jgi:hypothetical protein
LALIPILVAEAAHAQPPAQTPSADVPDVIVQPPIAPPPPEGTILVHIDSPRPVDLQLKVFHDADRYQTVCTSPCDKWVLARLEYRVVAAGQDNPGGESADLSPSRDFALPAGARRDTIQVMPRSESSRSGGIALTVAGAATIAVGHVWFLADLFLAGLGAALSGQSSGSAADDPTAPLVIILCGGVVLAAGIVLTVKSRTLVSHSVAMAGGAVGSPWAQRAAWREPSPEQRALPGTLGVPLFQIAF